MDLGMLLDLQGEVKLLFLQFLIVAILALFLVALQ